MIKITAQAIHKTRENMSAVRRALFVLSLVPGLLAGGLLWTSSVWAIQGELRTDTIWDKDGSPYLITDNLTIPFGKELSIAPGVEIRIEREKRIRVLGRLRAIGTAEEPILFTSNGPAQPGSWQQIYFLGTEASQSLLSHCVIEYAEIGIVCEQASPRILNCQIRSNGNHGIQVIESAPEILHNQILENGLNRPGAGILVRGRSSRPATISYNVIAHNRRDGLSVEDYAGVSVSHNVFTYNQRAGIAVLHQGQLIAVRQCNFIRNRKFNFLNQTPWEIDARENYWGWDATVELEAIGDIGNPTFIRDARDQPMVGIVRCVPWRSSPVDVEAAYADWVRLNRLPTPRTDVSIPDRSTSTSQQRGYVLYVYSDANRVLIDYNKHDNVKKGMRFDIQRDGGKIGQLIVQKTQDLWSEGIVQGADLIVRRGDRIVLPPLVIASDASWQSSRWHADNWTAYRLDPGQQRYWEDCQVFKPQEMNWGNGLNQLLLATSVKIIWNRSVLRRGKTYFRKTFDIDATPVQATIRWAATSPGELYLNDQWIARFTDLENFQELNVTPYLHQGKNVLAIVCERNETQNTPYGLGFEMIIQRDPTR